MNIKKTIRRAAAILTSFAMLFALSPAVDVGVSAAEEETVDGVTYTYEVIDDEAYLTGCSGYGETLVLPETLNGYPLVYLYDYLFIRDDTLKNITLPDTLVGIGYDAFYESALESVNFPASLVFVDDEAFAYCDGFTELTMPASVLSWGEDVFAGCSNVTSFTVEQGVEYLPEEVVSGCTSLTDVSLPDGLLSIGDGAFWNCQSLAEINIPDTVSEIGKKSFRKTLLSDVYISDTVTYIGAQAFMDCSFLNITGMKNVTYIGDDAFKSTGFYDSFDTPEIILGDGVLYEYRYSEIFDAVLPDGIKYVSPGAFTDCSGVQTVTFGEGLTTVYEYAFSSAAGGGLTAVYFPDTLEYIGESAFKNSTELEVIDGIDNVTYIGRTAFDNTAFLDNHTEDFVILGDGVLYAYMGDADNVTVPEGVKYLGGSAFDINYTYGITSVTIPEGVIGIQSHAFSCGSSLETVSLPDSLEYIDDRAFYGCSGLTSVELNNGLKYIGSKAFAATGLTEITIPASVEYIGSGAFGYNQGSYDLEPVEGFTVTAPAGSAGEFYGISNGFEVITTAAPEIIAGDVTGNGTVDAYDAALLQSFLVRKVTLTDTQLKAADANSDGSVNVFDVIYIKRISG